MSMVLLSVDDPIFVVDLCPETLQQDEASFADDSPLRRGEPFELPDSPSRPIRAVGLIFDWREDPLLIPISPTRDVWMLDAMARLIRVALITHIPVITLALSCGDEELRFLYLNKKLPHFIYKGVPKSIQARLPEAFMRIVGNHPNGSKGGPASDR